MVRGSWEVSRDDTFYSASMFIQKYETTILNELLVNTARSGQIVWAGKTGPYFGRWDSSTRLAAAE